MLMRSLAHEAAVIREFLAVEVSNGVVMVNEYALLQNSFQRTREERRILRKNGIKQWMRVKALYQTEIGLAFRKWHVSMGDNRSWATSNPRMPIASASSPCATKSARLRLKLGIRATGQAPVWGTGCLRSP